MQISAFAQVMPNAAFDEKAQQIIFLNYTDTVGSIQLDKTFKATLNHSKKLKKRTKYYRLAQYSKPSQVSQVPILITNTDIILHLTGTLQGDTSTEFSLICYKGQNNTVEIEISVKDVSVDQVSFTTEIRPYRFLLYGCTVFSDCIYIKKKKSSIEVVAKERSKISLFFDLPVL